MLSLGLLLAFVFTALAGLHLYWAAGGTWAARDSLPTTETGAPLFSPGRVACIAIAFGLLGFGYVCLAAVAVVPHLGTAGVTRAMLWIMFGVFTLRTIGDFRYVGLTRRVRATEFARRDRRIYTPLCALLAVGILRLAAEGLRS